MLSKTCAAIVASFSPLLRARPNALLPFFSMLLTQPFIIFGQPNITNFVLSTNLDRHDGEGNPEAADGVGDEDEADHHHEGRGHQH